MAASKQSAGRSGANVAATVPGDDDTVQQELEEDHQDRGSAALPRERFIGKNQ